MPIKICRKRANVIKRQQQQPGQHLPQPLAAAALDPSYCRTRGPFGRLCLLSRKLSALKNGKRKIMQSARCSLFAGNHKKNRARTRQKEGKWFFYYATNRKVVLWGQLSRRPTMLDDDLLNRTEVRRPRRPRSTGVNERCRNKRQKVTAAGSGHYALLLSCHCCWSWSWPSSCLCHWFSFSFWFRFSWCRCIFIYILLYICFIPTIAIARAENYCSKSISCDWST